MAKKQKTKRPRAAEQEAIEVLPLQSYRLRGNEDEPWTCLLQMKSGDDVRTYLLTAEHLDVMVKDFEQRAKTMMRL